MGKPNTSAPTKPESGVLPGTPAGQPATGPGIVPGTPDEKREQGQDKTRRRP